VEETRLLKSFKWNEEVLFSKEPVLVDFWAPWCGPCRAMHPVLQSLARDFKVAQVNVHKNPQLAGAYQVSSIPALMIFKGGKIVARYTGVTPEATLRAELEKHRGVQPANV
jgi:thioredoxin 1